MQKSIAAKNIIKYAALPGFQPRCRELFATGFQHIPYFIALVYGSVRLLPAHHPYLNPANIGRFGVRHVIAQAADNIVLSMRNIDQILLFFCILCGMVLITLQLGLLGIALFMQPAMAAMPTSFAGFFSTASTGDEAQDIAHIMLDMVFGVPDLFNSCVSQTGVACENIGGEPINAAPGASDEDWSYGAAATFPFPIHEGLHGLFALYNIGLTVVAAFIGIYFLFTIALETAESGTPMGKRFNKVWAPVRFVVAFGLLFPLNYGYNSSQYIVLYAAKFGSGFATNGWNLFNQTLSNQYSSGFGNLVGIPQVPEVGELLKFMYTAKVCAYATNVSETEPVEIKPYAVADPIRPNNALDLIGASYDQLITFADGDDRIIIRFGPRDENKYASQKGYVYPTCGELNLKLTDARPVADQEPGVKMLQEFYFEELLIDMWDFGLDGYVYPEDFTKIKLHTSANRDFYNPLLILADGSLMRDLRTNYETDLKTLISGSVAPAMLASGRWNADGNLQKKGWGGAGIWYNRIADMNGEMTSAVLNIPEPNRYPAIMEEVYAKKRQTEKNVDFNSRFDPKTTTGLATSDLKPAEQKMAPILWEAYDFAQKAVANNSSHGAATGNMIIDTLNTLLGTSGLFSMRENSDVHPLAQLAGVGRGLVEAAVRNLGIAVLGGGTGELMKLVDPTLGITAKTFSGIIVTFSTISLTAGFVLFYVVPFLPFIYFFFAVGGWVKGIFEAMVGAPLWALAHLRIDGNGLAGQAAVSGYFLIFEVFLRPILIIFGLLASISTFSALVSTLNQTFDLVIANLGGFDVELELSGPAVSKIEEWRSTIDGFFFTIIYVIIVYLMGMSSFKLVDLIPNNILRWMGQSVATFGDQREDSGQSLVGTATVGSQQTLSSLSGGIKELLK